ncbi:MAG: porin [Gemmatimonadaceae bacterium]|nr:porin [Gemmatimonadaceae bacterium]
MNRLFALLLPGLLGLTLFPASSHAQSASPSPAPRPWYERLSLRGYAQFRYNRLLETNADLTCSQCDRSIGRNGGFFLRRGRLVLSGDVTSRLSVHVQPDYASDAAGASHYLQLRDAYFDVFLDARREHRVRLGQSKVPFGFENLQSSQNRLPLDRSDALNSAVPNERDIGVFYYWATSAARRTFRVLIDSGLKGSGDYGIVGVGLMNGQTANRPEANNSPHVVARVSYPFRLTSGHFVELGISGYHGRFVLPSRTPGVSAAPEYSDQRLALAAHWYGQPLGVAAEWTWGEGPEYERSMGSIEVRRLHGGFVQAMYRWRTRGQVIQPFARAQYYTGGKKLELDARHHEVHEFEGGVEWLPTPAFELTAEYARASRVYDDGGLATPSRQQGGFLRLQAQINY